MCCLERDRNARGAFEAQLKDCFCTFSDEVHCAISCCTGRSEIRVSFFDGRGECLESRVENDPPSHIIDRLGLREPGYAGVCAEGLFGYERVA